MKLKQDEVRHGYYWLFASGLFVVSFSAFLQFVDHSLSTSKQEQVLAETLFELRSAQSFVARDARDPRETSAAVLKQNLSVHENLPGRSKGH